MLGRRLALLLSLLAAALWAQSPAPPAGILTVSPGVYPGLPWFALVSGRSGGECTTRLFQTKGPATQLRLAGFDVAGAPGLECPTRIAVFTAGRPPTILRAPVLRGAITVALKQSAEVQMKVWLLDCVGKTGQTCEQKELNTLEQDARQDWDHAFYQYATSFLGVTLGSPENFDDVSGTPWASELRSLPAKLNHEPDCTDFDTSQWRFAPGHLNVYYTFARKFGLACLPDPQAPAASLTRLGFVLIPPGSTPDLLSHELAHMILNTGEHPADDPSNVLSPDGGFARCNFSAEQALQTAHWWSGEPLGLEPLCEGRVDCQATLRLYQFACPQEVHRTLTDWVRCLHCSTTRPPKVKAPEGLAPLIQILKMSLGGHLRVQHRREIHQEALLSATAMLQRFPLQFKRARLRRGQLAEQETTRLVERYRERAMEAFLSSVPGPCHDMVRAGIAAFEWVLGDRTEDLSPVPPSAALRERLKFELENNLRPLCAQPAAQ